MWDIIKKRWRSKTYKFNLLVGVFAAGPQILPQLASFMTPEYYSTLSLVLTLGNLFFREITKVPLSKK